MIKLPRFHLTADIGLRDQRAYIAETWVCGFRTKKSDRFEIGFFLENPISSCHPQAGHAAFPNSKRPAFNNA
jgi:hypothetical protein